MIRLTLFFLVLSLAAVSDIRKRIIPDWMPLLIAGVSLIPSEPVYLSGLFVALPLLIAGITVGGIGGGDIKLTGACGLVLGFERTLAGLLMALSLLLLFHAVRKCIRKIRKVNCVAEKEQAYTSQFLRSKQNKKATIILWTLTYFVVQMVIFEVIQSRYPFNDVVSAIINVLLLLGMQWIFFRNGASGQLFVCFSFVAGKEIVKYIVSVLSIALGAVICGFIDALVMQGKIVTNTQVEVANNIVMCVSSFTSAILYALILGIYLILINKKYVRKEYPLQVQENVFLVLPSIAAVCISITLKMMIITVENGTTTLIFDTVPETLFWIPAICVLLLGAVIANVMLFQNVVQYHEENKKSHHVGKSDTADAKRGTGDSGYLC